MATTRPKSLAQSAITVAGLALVCLTAGSLLPGSSPAPPVPDRTVQFADVPAVSYAPEAPSAPVVDDPATAGSTSDPSATHSSATHSSATHSSRQAGSSKAGSSTAGSSKQPKSSAPKAGTSTGPAAPSATRVASGPALTQIAPAPALHISVPAIAVDADILPIDSVPTGRTNEFGGPIFEQIHFPVDLDVRQWVRRGDPNSIEPGKAAGDVKSFDRVVLYGHASSIGSHLVFQDLSELTAGQQIVVTTANGVFTYRVSLTATRAKVSLDNMPELYDYPKDGRKEIALVACLPDSTSNTVVIGQLVAAAKR